jgi:hypothetical protein
MARRLGGLDRSACVLAETGDMSRSRLRIYYSGRVQGVGFRYAVKQWPQGLKSPARFAIARWPRRVDC